MSYEKHLKELKELRGYDDGEFQVWPEANAALDAAIALMRAAAPKDEAAERKHCYRTASDWAVANGCPASLVEHERAAARAEGFKAGYDQAWSEAYPAP